MIIAYRKSRIAYRNLYNTKRRVTVFFRIAYLTSRIAYLVSRIAILFYLKYHKAYRQFLLLFVTTLYNHAHLNNSQ